ncbi:MAG: hypothetical protein Fur0042_28590 [Cyanophyceae cyanobacterium]
MIPAIATEPISEFDFLVPTVVRGNLTYQVGGCVDKACAPKGSAPRRAPETLPGTDPEPPSSVEVESGAIAPGLGVLNLVLEGGSGTLNFAYERTANCCFEFDLAESRDGNTIDVIETSGGLLCRCLCDFNLTGTIQNLAPGPYRVRLFQAPRQGDRQLVTTRQVDIKP